MALRVENYRNSSEQGFRPMLPNNDLNKSLSDVLSTSTVLLEKRVGSGNILLALMV